MLELRVETENDKTKIVGYAAKYNSMSQEIQDQAGTYFEIIEFGAFDGIEKEDIRLLYSHNKAALLGRTPDTLQLNPDKLGLGFSCEVGNTSTAHDCLDMIRRNELRGCSFGFFVGKDKWSREAGKTIRRIKSFNKITEISLTAFPAYESSELSLRNHTEFLEEQKQEEQKPKNQNAHMRLQLAELE